MFKDTVLERKQLVIQANLFQLANYLRDQFIQ